ncbi:hypothetical protein [Vibrio metschnikovii]|uniref:hypothetical protein n=1 Tax=Vibrio metschnikovii TaxID=28172 RepID=UPI001C2F1899|nr:hypothetical protein [Vibrio metschnikovii]
MDAVKGVIDKELYSHIKTDKEFCYLLWLMLMDAEVLSRYYDIFYDRHLATEGECTIRSSLCFFINEHVNFLYNTPSVPRTHDERFIDINLFLLSFECLVERKLNRIPRDFYSFDFKVNDFFKFIRKEKAIHDNSRIFNWLSPRDENLCFWTYNYLYKAGVIGKSLFYNNEDLILHCKVGFFLWGELDEVKSERYRRLILARDERNYRERKSKKTNRERTKRTSKKYGKKDVYENILLMLNKGADIDVIYDAVSDIRSRLVKFDGDLK